MDSFENNNEIEFQKIIYIQKYFRAFFGAEYL
jgi:hypothetical protein